MKYFIIAGEASGDLHGSNLVKQIFANDPNAQIEAWGGDKMLSSGAKINKHYRDLAFMGFVEVLLNLKTIFKNIATCKQQILTFNPDAIILIDYPGFNLRIAAWAKKQKFKIFYYIPPQIWAWKKNRVKKIRRDICETFCILPFEKNFYLKHNVKAEFVGHPLLDAIQNYKNSPENKFISEKDIIVLLPGSRKQEIKKMLSLMVAASKKYINDYDIIIAGMSNIPKEIYSEFIGEGIKIEYDNTYSLLSVARAAFVKSGTATLETALFNVPQVVCYKTSNISYSIAKFLIKVKFISLVNLIANKKIVTELIQNDLNVDKMHEEMDFILPNSEERRSMIAGYEKIRTELGGIGASNRTAKVIIQIARK